MNEGQLSDAARPGMIGDKWADCVEKVGAGASRATFQQQWLKGEGSFESFLRRRSGRDSIITGGKRLRSYSTQSAHLGRRPTSWSGAKADVRRSDGRCRISIFPLRGWIGRTASKFRPFDSGGDALQRRLMTDDRPIYLQLRDRIAFCITESEGDTAPLPSVRKLAAEHNANPLTVAKAYQSFQDEGLIVVKRGVGMFVANGASEKLRVRQRTEFLEHCWPKVASHIRRLDLDVEHLIGAASA